MITPEQRVIKLIKEFVYADANEIDYIRCADAILNANTTEDEQKPEWKTGTSDAFLDDIQQEDNE